MKKTLFICLIGMLSVLYAHSQNVIYLALPDNCEENITIKEETSVEEVIAITSTVFPNPSSGIFLIEISSINAINIGEIQVFNTSGSQVFNETVYCKTKKMSKQIDLTKQPPGSYVMRFNSNDEESSITLIIK